MKLLIIGSARHGKDTVAEMIHDATGMTYSSSSQAALDLFMMPILKEKYGLNYSSKEEAYADRVNHRSKWYDEICLYNKDDKARLAKDIMGKVNIYVGMRSSEELKACIQKGVFDMIIGVHDYRKPIENSDSNDIDIRDYANRIIVNDGSLESLREQVNLFCKFVLNQKVKPMALIDNPRIEYNRDHKTYKELKFFFFDEEFPIKKSFKREDEAIPIAKKFVGSFKEHREKLQPVLDKLIDRLTS